MVHEGCGHDIEQLAMTTTTADRRHAVTMATRTGAIDDGHGDRHHDRGGVEDDIEVASVDSFV